MVVCACRRHIFWHQGLLYEVVMKLQYKAFGIIFRQVEQMVWRVTHLNVRSHLLIHSKYIWCLTLTIPPYVVLNLSVCFFLLFPERKTT